MTTAAAAEFRHVLITALVASKTNPRTHFDQAYILELSNSILDKGLIHPIIVRPNGKAGTFEIVAGECRYRASKLAALEQVPVIVREYSDDQVLEAQLEENIHRKDLTPLEESAGYRRLIASNPTKHSAETIASRIGMSVSYVWDRLKLADLIPEAKAILELGIMSVGHAIPIARLKPADQKRAIAVEDVHNAFTQREGLWRSDSAFNFNEDEPVNTGKKPGKYDGLKTCSVRELEKWIQNHVRFDVAHAAQAQPLTFEETAAQVETAAAQPGRGRKVIAITLEQRVKDDARSDDERTYGAESWKRADGKGSKTCEYSVLGVVVAGRKQGSTLQVCVNRDKCTVHFADVVRRKAKTAKLRETGQDKKADRSEKRQEAAWEVQQRRQREEREKKERRWKAFYPALKKAVDNARSQLKTVNGAMYARVMKAHGLAAGVKPADLPMALLDRSLYKTFSHAWHDDEPRLVEWAKLLGVDVKALEPEKPKDEKPTAKIAGKKKR